MAFTILARAFQSSGEHVPACGYTQNWMLPSTIGGAYCWVVVDVDVEVVDAFGGAACVFERGLVCTRTVGPKAWGSVVAVSYTHLRAHET